MIRTSEFTSLIKDGMKAQGFDFCGISPARFLEEDAPKLEEWLQNQHHGSMSYMENHFDKRLDPRKLFDGCQSVVVVMQNYFPEKVQEEGLPKISKYAYGKDYHKVIKRKMQKVIDDMVAIKPDLRARCFVDSAPILERSWAVLSGLGWIGKNGMLINKKSGSFYFIGVLLLDIDLQYDSAFKTDHCGTCTACLDACPTDAILPNKVIDGSRCISHHTIELKDANIDSSIRWDDWIFGCDICQDVCPWNRFSIAHQEESFTPKTFLNYSLEDWKGIQEESFDKIFEASPIRRAKFEGIKRNLRFVYGGNE